MFGDCRLLFLSKKLGDFKKEVVGQHGQEQGQGGGDQVQEAEQHEQVHVIVRCVRVVPLY